LTNPGIFINPFDPNFFHKTFYKLRFPFLLDNNTLYPSPPLSFTDDSFFWYPRRQAHLLELVCANNFIRQVAFQNNKISLELFKAIDLSYVFENLPTDLTTLYQDPVFTSFIQEYKTLYKKSLSKLDSPRPDLLRKYYKKYLALNYHNVFILHQ